MESIEGAEIAQPQVRARRLPLTSEATLIVVWLCVMSTFVEGLLAISNSLKRASFPFADNQWSEGPLSMQLHRMAIGQPAYLSTFRVNSFDYGPLYLQLLDWWRVLSHHGFDIIQMRHVSMAFGLVTLVPLTACAVVVAGRIGVLRSDRTARLTVIVSALTAGLAVLSQGITFDSLHPDNLSYVFLASALLIFYLIATARLGAVWLVAMIAVCDAAVFTKQSSFTAFPLLVLGLAFARSVKPLWAIGGIVAYVASIGATLLLLPHDVVSWILRVPGAHPYQFTLDRGIDLFGWLTRLEPFLGLLLLLFPVTVILIFRSEGRRALWLDGAVIAFVLATAFAGFFKALGVWNNLTIIGVATVPYFSALLGVVVTPRLLGQLPRLLVAAALVLVLAVPLGLTTPSKQEPDATIYAKMQAIRSAAKQLCATGKPIAVTAYPDLFFGCKNATYTLMNSYGELRAAYPRYYAGRTDADVNSTATYVVALDAWGLPPPWVAQYKLIRSMPALNGWGGTYFPVVFEIYRLK